MAKYVIAVDAMGGDHAPGEIVRGAVLALRGFPDIRAVLCGPKAGIEALLSDASDVRARIEVLDAPDVIDIHEPPMLAVRRKTQSSLVQAALAVKEGRAQALVSAGPTGALLACGVLRMGRIRGIDRPALCPLVPGRSKPFLLVDGGANVDCQPEYLEQFGLMGSIYMRQVMGIETPNVCLANIGEEPEKGDALAKAAHRLMLAQRAYHFGGNVEAREFSSGIADVIVADGFTGNIILKYTEGLALALTGMLKDELMATTRSKLGALLLKPALSNFKKKMAYEEHGGAPLLGVKGALVKAHGSSNAQAIMNAIRQARLMVQGDVVGLIEKGLASLSPKGEANMQPEEKEQPT